MPPSSTTGKKVLVLNATGKTGRNVCRALKAAGFDVYGTTRSASNTSLAAAGVKPVVCNYTVRADLDRALAESGATKLFLLTDFFQAAGKSVAREVEQGKAAIAAAKAAGVDHLVFMSVADVAAFGPKSYHLHAKVALEEFLPTAGVPYSILGPAAFFENFDDPANWNPLKKGVVKFLSKGPCKFCGTYDIGKAAAVQLADPGTWLGRKLDVIAWEGTLADVAAALQKVSGTPTVGRLAMPVWARRLFFNDLHHMFLYYEAGGPKGSPADFKKVVPDAMSAEDWFRFHGKYSDGTPIAGGGAATA